jgi:hypothetical protein
VYVYIYKYLRMWIYVFVCTWTYICIYIHICIYRLIYRYTSTSLYVHMYIHIQFLCLSCYAASKLTTSRKNRYQERESCFKYYIQTVNIQINVTLNMHNVLSFLIIPLPL